MILVNDTPYSAILPATVLDNERMAASLVARVTYELDFGTNRTKAALLVADEQPWKASHAPAEGPRGPMEADGPFMKGGVDLYLFGSARTPKNKPITTMDVAVTLGDFTRRVVVTGQRVWLPNVGGGFRPSAAARFIEMPLTLAHAFGGRDVWDGLEVPWTPNPDGKGFVLAEADVEGKALPNVEEPDALITAWNDRPPVCGVGFCPMTDPERFKSGIVLSKEQNEILDLTPRHFNTAYPPMVAPVAKEGDLVTVSGMHEDGAFGFELPETPFHLHLCFGDKNIVRTPTVEGIGIEVDQKRVFVSYRFAFRYVIRPRELRHASLVARPTRSAGPQS
jgi:hypothetical protein